MRNLRHLIRYQRILLTGSDSSYDVHEAANDLHQAGTKQLQAKVYLQLGYVSADGVDHRGELTPQSDPYGHRARYFGAWSSRANQPGAVATGRLIEATAADDHTAFQTFRELTLYPEARQHILQYAPADCAEVSGLAKRSGESTTAILMLYREMWQYSLRNRQKLWLMAVDERLFARIGQLFGSALVPAGEPTPFKGHTVIPATLDLETSVATLKHLSKTGTPWQRLLRRRLAAFMMRGLDVTVPLVQPLTATARKTQS